MFCAIGLACRRAGVAGAAGAGASLFYHHSGAFVWRTLTGQEAGGDRAGDLRRAGAGEEPYKHVPLVGFMLTLAAAPVALRQYFQQKNHVPGDPPANHTLVVWSALIPVLLLCLPRGYRWPAAHAGESTPDRYADGSLAALPGVYRHPRRLWYLGLAAGAL